MKKIKRLMAKLERLRRQVRRGPGWLYLSLSTQGRFPTKEKPFRGLTLCWPSVTMGTQSDPFGDTYQRYAIHAQTGIGLAYSSCHRALEVTILGFGFSYSVQWDY